MSSDPGPDRRSEPVEVPPDVAAVGARYRRVESLARVVVALVAVVVLVPLVVTTYAALASLLAGLVGSRGLVVLVVPAVVVLAGVVGLLAGPLVRPGGEARLATDADPATVRAALRGPTPPPLALYWGMADEVRAAADGDGGVYRVSYLAGLRSTTLEATPRAVDGSDDVEVVVTTDGRPWVTYRVAVAERDGRTVAEVAWAADRAVGLRRLSQTLVGRRYWDDAVAAAGYEVLERDARLRGRPDP